MIGRFKLLVLLLSLSILSACGGGGGGGSGSSNKAPTASGVSITDNNGGDAVVGDILTGSYTYNDTDGDAEGTSTFRWLRNGVAITGATGTNYTLLAADSGQAISFEVTPVALTGTTTGAAVTSGSLTVVNINSAPTASGVSITDNNGGDAVVGDILTGSYTYNDTDGDAEGTSTFRWLRNGVAITGATTISYTLVASDVSALIAFEVTPVAGTGIPAGSPVLSSGLSPVIVQPTTPQNIQTLSGTQQITVSWNAVANATSYRVYWNNTGSVTTSDATLDAGTATQITHNNLDISKTYYYRVAAVISVTESTLSTEVSNTPGFAGWAWANPTPQGNVIYDMASFGPLFVAVGQAGTILTSNDGINWLRQASGTKNNLLRISVGNGRLIAVGSSGTLLTSTDAVSWSAPTLPTSSSNQLGSVIYTGSEWLAIGSEYKAFQVYESPVLRSTDGLNWQAGVQIAPATTAGTVYSGIATDGVYTVALDLSGKIYRTNDVTLSNWTLVHDSAGAYSLRNVVYANNQFVAVGSYDIILTSPDGLTWTPRISNTTGHFLLGISYNGSQWVVVGSGDFVLTSSDAVTWTKRVVSLSPGSGLNTITYNASQSKWSSAGMDMITSSNAIDWTNHSSSAVSSNLMDIAYNGSFYLAATESGSVVKSTNGINWTHQLIGVSPAPLFRAITYSASAGLWVGVGWNGAIVTSSDGNIWTIRASGITAQLLGVAHNGSQWLAVSSAGDILTSPDAFIWTVQTSGTTKWLYGAAHDGAQWVVVGQDGIMLKSTDGISWSLQTSGIYSLNNIAHNGNQWVVVGASGTILTSTDAVTWTTRASGVPHHFNDITYSGTHWVAIGGFGQVVTSTDGISWTQEEIPYGSELYGVVTSSSLWVTVGQSGAILVRKP